MKKIILFCLCLFCVGCAHFFDNEESYSYKGKTKIEITEMIHSYGFLPQREVVLATLPEGKSIYEEVFRRGYFLVGSSVDIEDRENLMSFVKEMGFAAVFSQGNMLWYGLKMNPMINSGLLTAKLPENFLRSRGVEGVRLVTAVMNKSSAYYANIQEGDCVHSLNGKVCTTNPLLEATSNPIVVFRAGKELHKVLISNLLPDSQEAKDLLEKNKKRDQELFSGETAKKPTESISCGSGFFITENGYLLTSRHVVFDARRLAIMHSGSEEMVQAVLVAEDKENDIALLKVETEKSRALPLASSFTLQRGAEVMSLGYPQPDYQGARQKATFGRVNATSGFRDDMRFTQVDVPIQEGNSGGPLLDRYGNVVGVISSRLLGGESQNVNYALKVDYVKKLLESVPEASRVLILNSDNRKKNFTQLAEAEEASVVLVLCFK